MNKNVMNNKINELPQLPEVKRNFTPNQVEKEKFEHKAKFNQLLDDAIIGVPKKSAD